MSAGGGIPGSGIPGSGVLGQGEAFARLLRQARALRMHHGLMLTGPRGIGKTTAAEHVARAVLCHGDDPHAPCGDCASCTRFANHPDLSRVEIPEDKDEIPVDLVRDLRESLQRLPVMGRARVVVIDPADRLNVQGQNALLKTLEEPGRRTFLLLPTSRPEGLLDTVRSRVSELRILPLADEVIAQALASVAGANADLRTWATRQAEGCLGLAQALMNEESHHLFALLEDYVHGAQGTPVTTARAALQGVSGRVASLERARWILWTTRTILRKELLGVLATESTGPYSAATSVRCTTKIESLFDAETDLSLRIPPEQVLVQALTSIRTLR